MVIAPVVELAYTRDLKSLAEKYKGSSPFRSTIRKENKMLLINTKVYDHDTDRNEWSVEAIFQDGLECIYGPFGDEDHAEEFCKWLEKACLHSEDLFPVRDYSDWPDNAEEMWRDENGIDYENNKYRREMLEELGDSSQLEELLQNQQIGVGNA
tara:strand:- start:432 stop:893 length:462 start_codon:yes stop_codon:yes gene_type:complete